MKIHIPRTDFGPDFRNRRRHARTRGADRLNTRRMPSRARPSTATPWQQHSDPRRRGSEARPLGQPARQHARENRSRPRDNLLRRPARRLRAQVRNEGFDGEVVVPAPHAPHEAWRASGARAHASHAHPAAPVRRPGRGARPADTAADRGNGKTNYSTDEKMNKELFVAVCDRLRERASPSCGGSTPKWGS